MRIFVCIKQVPDTTVVDIDPETMTLKRAGIDTKINPFDLYAIETAIKLKEMHKATVCTLSMGPPQTDAAIRETFKLGADAGILLTDRKFAGADVLATSYTISQGILSQGIPDLIICGQQTTDGDTGQVGPEIAEFLNIPHVAYVRKIVYSDNKGITVEMDMPDRIEVVRVDFPCLITVLKDICQPRLPSFKLGLKTQDKIVKRLSLEDLPDTDYTKYGLSGSPTQVLKIFPPATSTDHVLWEGNPETTSSNIFAKLKELKFL